jgi:hypothetical protein
MSVPTTRLNLYLPRQLVEELRRVIPPGKRADFVAQALDRELRRARLLAAIEAAAGAWREGDHPDLNSGTDIDRWIEGTRREMRWDRASEDRGG